MIDCIEEVGGAQRKPFKSGLGYILPSAIDKWPVK